MAQKFFDIFPPTPPSVFPEKQEKAISSPPKKKWQKVVLWSLLLFFLAVFLVLFKFSRAEIEIWPEIRNLNFSAKVEAVTEIGKTDPSRKIIPAKIFEEESSFVQKFLTSGKKEKRAEGMIRVYNNYSTSPQTLVATTRFVSAEGKIFRTPVKVTIPGAYYEGRKLVPGFIDIKVIADRPGEEYNIGPTTFSIPGFVGTQKYTAFYGKSFEAMKGGGYVSEVSQEDLEKAEKILTEKAYQESNDSLKRKIPSGFVLLEKGISQEILEATSDKEAGQEAESFIFQVKVKSQAITFSEADLENLVKELIVSQVPQLEKLKTGALKIDYLPELVDLKTGRVVLNLTVTGKAYSLEEEVILKEALRGKSLMESKILLENKEGVIKVQIKTWPIWLKRIPKDIEKIRIKIKLD